MSIVYVFPDGYKQGTEGLRHDQIVIRPSYGRYGVYIVYMTYIVFLLFFIPCFKWNKQYYVRMSCCNATYRLNTEEGKRIARDEKVEILPEDLQPLSVGWQQRNLGNQCLNCGFTTNENYEFCQKCGKRL